MGFMSSTRSSAERLLVRAWPHESCWRVRIGVKVMGGHVIRVGGEEKVLRKMGKEESVLLGLIRTTIPLPRC